MRQMSINLHMQVESKAKGFHYFTSLIDSVLVDYLHILYIISMPVYCNEIKLGLFIKIRS
jgi:hypothetical protein